MNGKMDLGNCVERGKGKEHGERYNETMRTTDLDISFQEALLYAITEEYVEGVEELLSYEEKNHKTGEPYVSN